MSPWSFFPHCYNDFSLILLKTCSTILYFLDQSISLGDSLPVQIFLVIIADVVSAVLRKLLTNTYYNYGFYSYIWVLIICMKDLSETWKSEYLSRKPICQGGKKMYRGISDYLWNAGLWNVCLMLSFI